MIDSCALATVWHAAKLPGVARELVPMATCFFFPFSFFLALATTLVLKVGESEKEDRQRERERERERVRVRERLLWDSELCYAAEKIQCKFERI